MFWCLGFSAPGVGVSVAVLGAAVLLYVSPLIFSRQKIFLRRQVLYFSFIAAHLIFINPLGESKFLFDFTGTLLFSFTFFIVLVSLADRIEVYERMIFIVLCTTTLLSLYLMYVHYFVYHSVFLSPNLAEFARLGRTGKNTLSFFLCSVFPFAYAYFSHRKYSAGAVFVFVITTAALYTLSRMALIALGFSLVLFCIFPMRRKMFFMQLIVVTIALLLVNRIYGIGLKTFLMLGNPTYAAEIESGRRGFVLIEGHRGALAGKILTGFAGSPVFGHGLTSFRYAEGTGGSVTHNDYGQILYELGLVGALLFGMILIGAFKDMVDIRREISHRYRWLWEGQVACLFSICIMMLFMNVYEAIPFWFCLAGTQILYKVVREGRRNEGVVEEGGI